MINEAYQDLVKDLVEEYGSYLFKVDLSDIPKLEEINKKHKNKTHHLTLIIARLYYRKNALVSLQDIESKNNRLILKHPNIKGLAND